MEYSFARGRCKNESNLSDSSPWESGLGEPRTGEAGEAAWRLIIRMHISIFSIAIRHIVHAN